MKRATIALLGFAVVGLSGCYTDRIILTDAQGRRQACEFKGHVGIVSPIVTHQKYQNCIDKAKADGFRETSPAA